MTAFKKKLGAGLAALALTVGAVPGTVSMASAYENPNGGQHFDRGRFPRTYHIALMLGALVGLYFVVRSNGTPDTPASP